MRLFFYYVTHSIINGLKRSLKTWLIFFLVFFLIFGGIGMIVGNNIEEEPTEIVEEALLTDYQALNLMGLVVGAIVIVIIMIFMLNSEDSVGKIMLPADTALLFPSPLKPQGVLLFRLMSKMGTFLFASIYALIYIPNWMGRFKNPFSTITAAFILIFILIYGELIQIIFYLIKSNHYKFKNYILIISVGIPIIMLLSFGIFYINNSYELIDSSFIFFNSKIMNMIPIYGSLKSMFMATVNLDIKAFLINLLLNIIYIFILGFIMMKIDADFYEDALSKSEELNELKHEMENGTKFAKRKKDRPDRIRRNEFNFGYGANVFFFKEMYNRFRFARWNFFTKTMSTYLILGVGSAIFTNLVIKEDGLIGAIIIITAIAFYRTLGNSLPTDLEKPFFILIPEKTKKKMFYALISGTVNSFLDILPAYIISLIISKSSIILMIVGLMFTLTMDYYSTTVGAFIDLSVSQKNIGNTLKVLIQILFIYFGLVPDAIIIVVLAIILKARNGLLLGLLIATAINILIGTVFFFLCPRFLEPKVGMRGKGKYTYVGKEKQNV